MQKSTSIQELAKALSAVQKELKPAIKDADNPFFKSKYADLNSVWDSCRQPLAANGLSVVQGNSVGLDGTVIVETMLLHSSGEWIQSELALPLAKHDPQGVGSAVTYGRRYGLAAMVGIVADVDDDGNHASGRVSPAQANGAKAKANAPKAVEEPTAREIAIKAVAALGGELNGAGDSIKWSGKVMSAYITEMFGAGVSIENINEAQLKTLHGDLEERLASLTNNGGGK